MEGERQVSTESTGVTQPIQPIQPIQPNANNPVARRALLITAGLGVCAAGAAATPYIAGKVGELTQDAAKAAYDAGINAGREALLAELSQLEDVTLEGAIAIAELTKLAVNYIALPVSRVVAGAGTVALQGFADALSTAQDALGKIGQHNDQIDRLHDVVITWKTALGASPTILSDIANKDINSAEKYLRALDNKIKTSKTATPTK
jgi:hypothetical protein